MDKKKKKKNNVSNVSVDTVFRKDWQNRMVVIGDEYLCVEV